MNKRAVILLLSLFLVSFVSAGYNIGNLSNSLGQSYGPSENISGWINISFSEQAGDSLLSDGRGNSIRLVDLLQSQESYNYDCIPTICDNSYSSLAESTAKSFSMGTGESKLIGFKLSGEVSAIQDIEFKIESNAGSHCYNQVEIDFLNDGSFEKGNTNIGTGSCSFLKEEGCYESSTPSQELLNIGQTPYCQRITLGKSPGFNLGAWVQKIGEEETIRMVLKNSFGNDLEGTSCELENITESGSEVSCEIDFLLTEEEDYYVCIDSNKNTEYKLKGYEDQKGCGFYGEGVQTESAAYSIFVQGREFGPVGNLTVDNDLANGNTLSSKINDYLAQNYEFDCSSSCIIPVRIRSGKSQDLTIKDLKLEYQGSLGVVSSDKFYDLEESFSKVSSEFGRLDLAAAGFLTPSEFGDYSFSLNLADSEILTKTIFVEKVPTIIGLTPTLTVSALPTEFEVEMNSSRAIENYLWNFGDGSSQTTEVNRVTHAYSSTGTYNLELVVRDELGKSSSRTFSIVVGEPQATISKILEEKSSDLEKVNSQIGNYSPFYKTELNLALDLVNLDNKIKELQRRFTASFQESEFNQIMTELFDLRVPSNLYLSGEGESISFAASESDINLDVVAATESSSTEVSERYKQAVLEWNQENMDMKVSFEEFSAEYDSPEKVGGFYVLEIVRKGEFSYTPYLFIQELEDLSFGSNYFENKESNYFVIELGEEAETIEFFTSEKISLEELPAFISPGLDRLSIIEPEVDLAPESGPTLLILVLIFIFILGIIIYIVMQEWYKKRYENYLFKDQTNLFNLINYIENSKKKGLDDNEISKKLKGIGWSNEQTNYALKKHAGKRTGMIEIPISKILGQKVSDEPKVSTNPPKAVKPANVMPRIPQRIRGLPQRKRFLGNK